MIFTAKHNEQFYFTLVSFLVEDYLFRVPRTTLEEESDVFRDLFLLPVEADRAEGTDDNPIVLEGIKKEDFESLLKVLYPIPFSNLMPDGLLASLEECTSVLKLSKMWGFHRIHESVIQHMEPILAMKPLDKVAIAQEFGITRWLAPGLLQLARRVSPVREEDVRRLGLETALKLAEVRESIQTATMPVANWSRNRAGIGNMPTITATAPRGATLCDYTHRIHEVFELPYTL